MFEVIVTVLKVSNMLLKRMLLWIFNFETNYKCVKDYNLKILIVRFKIKISKNSKHVQYF